MPTQRLYVNICISFIHNHLRHETNQLSTSWWVDKKAVAHPHNRVPTTNRKNGYWYTQHGRISKGFCEMKESRRKKLRIIKFDLDDILEKVKLSAISSKFSRGIDYKGTGGKFWAWWKYSLCLMWWPRYYIVQNSQKCATIKSDF